MSSNGSRAAISVSNTKLVSTYRYRHGYFDGVEREFRGFAYVEQRDAESVVGRIRPAARRHEDLVPQRRLPRGR